MVKAPISRRSFLGGALAALSAPALVGCASMETYKAEATVVRGRHVIIENFGTGPVDPGQVDALLEEVARLMKVELDPAKPKARIRITTPSQIAQLSGSGAATFPGHSQAVGLYFAGASLVLVPRVDRQILGHELAHYVTDHYLKDVPRKDWEKVAFRIESKLA